MESKVIFITGVSGSGKSTIGALLSSALSGVFLEGDDFHPVGNIEKMTKGIPLTDEDRWPWLKSINQAIKNEKSQFIVVACSALKSSYRNTLAEGIAVSRIRWIHLQGDFDLIFSRMRERTNHFMSPDLLKSQYADYEEPNSGQRIDIDQPVETIMQNILNNIKKSDIGLIGLGVMGKSLARNIASKGFGLSLYNRHVEGQEVDVALKSVAQFDELANALPYDDLKDFVDSLSHPRKILLMVNAGTAVDDIIDQLRPYLTEGDVVMDGGNSDYKDTQKREQSLKQLGIQFVGCGISGGEHGALKGPAIMPGGSKKGYYLLQDLLHSIAAKNRIGETCCEYIGDGGAGHFVKMVHNGIEYAEMQLIADMYAHLRWDQNLSLEEIHEIFNMWCESECKSYLLEITLDIIRAKDDDGSPLLDKILDKAENKGTGSWTTIAACELGVAVPSLTEALFARYLSHDKKMRENLSLTYPKEQEEIWIDTENLKATYQFCRMMNHIQGLEMIHQASKKYDWQIDIDGLLRTWSGGCIIRSTLLQKLRTGYKKDQHLLQSAWMVEYINTHWKDIKKAASQLALSNLPYATVHAAIAYFKYITIGKSNANMIQAQRDYFGAHTYQRVDDPESNGFHTQWLKM